MTPQPFHPHKGKTGNKTPAKSGAADLSAGQSDMQTNAPEKSEKPRKTWYGTKKKN
jgi:hypothetical protein